MKHLKHLFTLLLLVLCSQAVKAYDFEVDGIYYNISMESIVEVTSGDTYYTGNVVIPSVVEYEGTSYSVVGIGSSAFNGCEELSSVQIPSSVKYVGAMAFYACGNLLEIHFSENVESLGENVLACCSNLERISVDDGNQYYKVVNEALLTADMTQLLVVPAANNNLGSVYVVPDGVTAIADYAFVYNKSVSRIEFPDGVLEIGDYAFGAIKSNEIYVSIPESIKRIGANVFLANFSSTIRVDISATTPPEVKAFDSCAPIVFYVPKGAKDAYDIAPWNNPHTIVEKVETFEEFEVAGFRYKNMGDNTCEVIGFVGEFSDMISIPSSVEYNSMSFIVTSIAANVFESNNALENIIIPASITYVSGEAFSGCEGLTILTMIGTNPPSAGENIDEICQSLSTVFVPAGTKEIYDATIWNVFDIMEMPEYGTVFDFDGLRYEVTGVLTCKVDNALEKTTEGTLRIPSVALFNGLSFEVTAIDNSAFMDSGITSVIIPNSVKSIGSNAFSHCPKLAEIVFPSSLEYIGDFAFMDCSSLTSLFIPSYVTYIGEAAFCECEGVSSIIVDVNNTAYDSREDCNAIIDTNSNVMVVGCKNSFIPNTVTRLGRCAFRGTKIKSLSIPNSVTHIGNGAFYMCQDLVSVSIPNSVISIDTQAFMDCSSLTSVMIPDNVSKIGLGAFANCYGLRTVIIPSSVKTLGMFTFSDCRNLASVIMLGTEPPAIETSSDIFYKCPNTLKVYVPLDCKDSYNVSPWCNYSLKESFNLTVTSAGYATLYLDYAVEIPEDVEVYIAKEVKADKLKMEKLEGILPANTGVIVKADAGMHALGLVGYDVPAVLKNLFYGTVANEMIDVPDNYKAYVLAMLDGEVGMYLAELTNGAFLNNANKAYLMLPSKRLDINDDNEVDTSAGGQLSSGYRFDFSDTTSVDDVIEQCGEINYGFYDLQGRKVENPARGVYIINGRKVFVK